MKKRTWRPVATFATVAAMLSGAMTVVILTSSAPPAAADPIPVDDGVAVTEEEALVEAARTGEPVEVQALRGEQRDVAANPDGTFTATEYATPVRTRQDGQWAEIDPTLVVGPDGLLRPVASTVDVVFSGGGDQPLATTIKNGRSMTVDWPGPLPDPLVEGSTATYEDVLSGVDLVVQATGDGFSHTLIVADSQAAANPELSAVELELVTDGASASVTADGGLVVIDDASGGVLFEASTPIMWDSGSETAPAGVRITADEPSRQAEVGIAIEGDVLTLTPDTVMLTADDTVFPVYIDPIVRDENRSAWAMVNSGYPSQSYYKFAGSTDGTEGLGYCGFGTCNSVQVKRLLYKVTTSFYAGKDILAATFAVTPSFYAYGGEQHDVDLYLMPAGITSGTTWNSKKDEWTSKIATKAAPSSADQSCRSEFAMEWNVLSQMRTAAADGKTSMTLGLRNNNESSYLSWMRFCDNGHLRIRYNTPPFQPKTEEMSMSPGGNCTYALTDGAYTNTLPVLRARLHDADGAKIAEQLRAQYRLVWGDGDAHTWTWPTDDQIGQSPLQDEGSLFSLDLTTAPGLPSLPQNAPLGWIVRAWDGVSFGPWSWAGSATRCRFVIDSTFPDAPTVTSPDFPSDGSWADMVGETGRFDLSTTDGDVTTFRYDFTGDDRPRGEVPVADGVASIEFTPDRAAPYSLTVWAVDAAGNNAGAVYDFAARSRPAVASWGLDEPSGATEAADSTGATTAYAAAGVTFGESGPGSRTAATFDGTADAYLSTNTRGLVPTGDGFAVSAWVQIDDLSRDQSAVSVNGPGEAGFDLGFESTGSSTGHWVFETPDLPFERFTTWSVTGSTVDAGEWAHLLGVYDAQNRELRLYVNGELAGTAERRSTWNATGTIEIGRSLSAGMPGSPWTGSIADVAVFDRLVTEAEVRELSAVTAIRLGYWQLNAAPDGASPEYTAGTPLILADGAQIYGPEDPFAEPPLKGEGHLVLDGVAATAGTAVPVIDTADSFSVSAVVRMPTATATRDMTVLSMGDGMNDMFVVRYSATLDTWLLVVRDVNGVETSIVSPSAPSGDREGSLIAVSYNAFTDQVTFYVDGVASAPHSVPFTDPWTASEGLTVGRCVSGEFFVGDVDDVRVYRGALDLPTVQLLGRSEEQPWL